MADVELIYKTTVKASERGRIADSKNCYELLLPLWNEAKMERQEEFKVLRLHRASRVKGIYEASMGGLAGTVADPRLILAAAIKSLSIGLLLSHNHPFGNLKPSRADKELTSKIKEAARYHNIKVLDHIILTSDGYFSFADEGLL